MREGGEEVFALASPGHTLFNTARVFLPLFALSPLFLKMFVLLLSIRFQLPFFSYSLLLILGATL
jgi:hypothetical protein